MRSFTANSSLPVPGSDVQFKYACPGPNALSPFFDFAFARLGYFRTDAWSLWARRHDDQWMVMGHQMTLQESFQEMQDNPWFHL